MSEGQSIEIRNRDGETKTLPQGPLLQEHLLAGWNPTDPEARIVVTGEDDNGELDTTVLNATAFRDAWVETNGGISIQDVDTTVDISSANNEVNNQRRQEEMFRSGGARAVSRLTNFSDQVTFGGVSALTRQLDPEAYRIIEETSARDPLGTLGFQGLGMLASLAIGGSGAAGGASALAGAGAATVRAGQAARSFAAARGGGRLAQSLADNLAQGITGGVAFNVADSIARNRPLSGERIVSDAGIDIALGLGIDAIAGGAGSAFRRFRNVARRTESGRELVHSTRIQRITPETVEGMSQQQVLDLMSTDVRNIEQDLNPLQRGVRTLQETAIGAEHADELALVSQHRRDLAGAADRIDGIHAENLARRLQRIQDLESQATEQAQGLARLDTFADDFNRVNTPEGLTAIRTRANSAIDNLRHGWDELAQGATSSTGEAAWRKISKNLKATENVVNRSRDPRAIYEEIRGLREAISSNIDSAVKEGSRATNREATFFRSINDTLFGKEMLSQHSGGGNRVVGLLNDEQLWGQRLVQSEALRGAYLDDLREGNKRLANTLTEKSREVGPEVRAFSPRRIGTTLSKISKGTSDDILRAMQEHIIRTSEGAKQLQDIYGGKSGDLVKALNEEAEAALKDLAVANFDARLVRARNTLLAQETKLGQAGLINSGVFLGGVGFGIGGGLAGGASAAVMSHILRPGSSYTRLGSIENVFYRFKQRITGAQRQIRQNLKSRLRVPKASARRVVPPTVFLLRGEKDSQEQYKQMRDELQRITPESLAESINESTLVMRQEDPEIADEMAMTLVRAQQYLTISIPSPGSSGMLSDPIPSKVEMDAFIEKYLGVQDPLSMLEDFADGRLTQEKAQAVLAVYPQMHAEMVNDVIEVFSEFDPEEVPYQYKAQLSLLLDVPADATFTTEFVAAMQNIGAQTAQQSISVRSMTPGGINDLSMVTGPLTENQRVFDGSN